MENKTIPFLKKMWTESVTPTIQSFATKNKENSDKIVRAIEDKEEISINNPEKIVNPLLEAQNATTQAIKEIPVQVFPEVSFDSLESKIEALQKTLEDKKLEVNIGETKLELKPVIEAIQKIKLEVPKMEKQEVIDYTLMFDEMMTIMERPQDHTHTIEMKNLISKVAKSEDIAILAEYLQNLIDKPELEFPDFPRDEKGIPYFHPTKVGGGGGGGIQSDLVHENHHTGVNELRVYSEGHVCTQNSTSTPLGINGVFTGDWQDTLDYSEVIISVGTDKASITNGLQVLWSADAINNHGDDVFTISANADKTFSFPCQRRYVKIIYTNDGVAQTRFNLSTLLKRYASKGSSHRLADTLDQQDDSIVCKSLIAGKTTAAGGAIVDVKVNPSGALTVAPDNATNLSAGGKISVGTSAVEATFAGTTRSIIITADKDNSGILYVGKSDVTNLGANALTYLEAGDSITIDYDDVTNALYVVASAASQNFWKGATL